MTSDQAACRGPYWLLLTVGALAALASSATADDELYASTTSADGRRTNAFYRHGKPLTAVEASAKCAAMGGRLLSLQSPAQVNESLWASNVVAAADTSLIWTGLKISWTGSKHRRMLASASSLDHESDDQQLYQQLLHEMEHSTQPVPTSTHDGRQLPQEVRLFMYLSAHRRSLLQTHGSAISLRSLLDDSSSSSTPNTVRGGVVTWEDGSSTDLVVQNEWNLGFLACGSRRTGTCCGAVYDIGPAPYPGSPFPTVFFHPCDKTASSGSAVPTGYGCDVASTAELPGDGDGGKPGRRKPGASPTKVCKKGQAPVVKGEHTKCRKCRRNTYSDDGLSCKRCPQGTTSRKGAAACKT